MITSESDWWVPSAGELACWSFLPRTSRNAADTTFLVHVGAQFYSSFNFTTWCNGMGDDVGYLMWRGNALSSQWLISIFLVNTCTEAQRLKTLKQRALGRHKANLRFRRREQNVQKKTSELCFPNGTTVVVHGEVLKWSRRAEEILDDF
jgi:hypothetical protein